MRYRKMLFDLYLTMNSFQVFLAQQKKSSQQQVSQGNTNAIDEIIKAVDLLKQGMHE